MLFFRAAPHRRSPAVEIIDDRPTCSDPLRGHPREHLAAYGGILQVVAYAGYNDLYEGRREPATIVEAACWSHGRRKFFDLAKFRKAPIAVESVCRIDEIFAVV